MTLSEGGVVHEAWGGEGNRGIKISERSKAIIHLLD